MAKVKYTGDVPVDVNVPTEGNASREIRFNPNDVIDVPKAWADKATATTFTYTRVGDDGQDEEVTVDVKPEFELAPAKKAAPKKASE